MINADALMGQLEKKRSGPGNQRYTEGFNDALMRFRSMIHSAPTIEARPVRHGTWEAVNSAYWRWYPEGARVVNRVTYRCSRCGRGAIAKTDYCTCGAKMDGGGDCGTA